MKYNDKPIKTIFMNKCSLCLRIFGTVPNSYDSCKYGKCHWSITSVSETILGDYNIWVIKHIMKKVHIYLN